MRINSKILKFLCAGLTTLSLGFTSTVIASCSYEPVDETPRIEAPSTRSKTTVLDQEGQTTITFWGFQYCNIDIGLITVKDNFIFPEGLKEESISVYAINPDNHTFAVQIVIIGDGEAEGIKGNFSFESKSHQEFKYDDSLEFELTLLQYDSITLPDETVRAVDINPSGKTVVEFHDFIFHGSNVGEQTFEVRNTFSQGDVKFDSQVTNLRVSDHKFDVKITISEDLIPSRSLVGRFQFYRDGILVPIKNDSDITIIIDEAKRITIPDDVKRFYSTSIDKNLNATFTIPNIQFTGLEDPDKLQISNSGFESAIIQDPEDPSSQTYCDEINFSVNNWSIASKSFDIVVTFKNCHSVKRVGFFDTFTQIDCPFVFTYDGKEIPLNISETNTRFDYRVNNPIPTELLNIDGNGILLGLKSDVPEGDWFQYSMISIPETVVEISDEAFKDVFITKGTGATERQNIQYISFENAFNLKKIGKNAFSGCDNLTNKFINSKTEETVGKLGLSLPSTLSVVDDYAFAGCSFDGSLLFPYYSINNITLGMAPFKGCLFDEIYMSTAIQNVAYTYTTQEGETPVVPEGEGSFCGLQYVKTVHFEYYDRGIPTWISDSHSDVHLFDDIGSQYEDEKVDFWIWQGSAKKDAWEDWLTTKASLSLDKIDVKEID